MTDTKISPNPPSTQRRKPKQLRSVETMNSILESASTLFEEQGYDKTTTHQIAARASVSVGALYRYFADKEAILKEVYRRETSVLRDRILEEFSSISIADKDPRSLVREALERAFRIYSERPLLRRVLGEQSRRIPDLAVLRKTQEEELFKTVGTILSSVPEIELHDVEVGGYLVVLFVDCVLEDFLLHRHGYSDFTTNRVLDATTDMMISYLLKPKS